MSAFSRDSKTGTGFYVYIFFLASLKEPKLAQTMDRAEAP